jgi:cell division transport system permease protein
MINWLRLHLHAISDALKHVLSSAGSFSLNVLVIAIALALPIAGFTILENVRPVSEQLAVDPEISIFMAMDTPREQVTALAPQIRRVVQDAKYSARLEFIPREHALTLFNSKTGLADAVTALGENPLPDGYVVKISGVDNATEAGRIETLAASLKALPGVEYVQVDSAWVKRLAALLHVLRLALVFLAATLAVVVIAVVFNTIRLQVMTQRDEIEVCRMFGAADSYIYRPFYYTGALLGLVAGAAALGVVTLALLPLNDAVAEFARLYASEFRLTPLSAAPSIYFLTTSALLGLAGAVLCVRRHLARLA